MAEKAKAAKESKLSKIMKAPIRALIKIKDLYVLSMSECSGNFDVGAVMGCPTAQVTALPRSFSASSAASSRRAGADDYRELVKAASTRTLGNRIEIDSGKRQPSPATPSPPNGLFKSRSVGIARIDEDKACEFGDDDGVFGAGVYPRSRSYAVHRRKMAS